MGNFQNHQLFYEKVGSVEVFDLRVPGTNDSRIIYYFLPNVLVVQGDRGNWMFEDVGLPNVDNNHEKGFEFFIRRCKRNSTQQPEELDVEATELEIKGEIKKIYAKEGDYDGLGENELEIMLDLFKQAESILQDQGAEAYILWCKSDATLTEEGHPIIMKPKLDFMRVVEGYGEIYQKVKVGEVIQAKKYIVQFNEGNRSSYLANWEGDPGRTLKRERAKEFNSRKEAEVARLKVIANNPHRFEGDKDTGIVLKKKMKNQ